MKLLALICAFAISLPVYAGTFEITSTGLKPIRCDAPASSGLEAVWVVADMSDATAVYTASNPGARVEWQRFSTLGGGFAEAVTATDDGQGRWSRV